MLAETHSLRSSLLPIGHAEHHDSLDRMDKMRLFMCYCATHPGKLDDTRQQQWMTLAKLSAADLAAVCNLAYMGVQVVKPGARTWGSASAGKLLHG